MSPRHYVSRIAAGLWLNTISVVLPCAILLLPEAARAQVVPPPGSPLPGVLVPTPPQVSAAPAPALVQPTPVNPALMHAITGVSLEGATVFTAADLGDLLAGLTGPQVPVARIEAARAAILNRYRAAGFVYVTVYARISHDRLRFVVTEGRIVDVKLDGDIGPAATQVLKFLNHLTAVAPIDTATLERWILLAGDVPGVSISVTVNPSATDPGALTLIARLTRTKFNGQVQADNRAFRETGPQEIVLQGTANSFTSLGERTQVSLFHSPDNTESFGQLSEDFFVGGSGLRVHLYGGAGETTPSGSLAALGYDGITRVGGVELDYPLIRSRRETLNLSALLDVIESDIHTDTGANGQPARASFDSLRVLRAAVDYALYDIWLGPSLGASDQVNARVSQGLPDFGASNGHSRDLARLNERIDFTKANASAERLQSLFSLWNGAGASIRLAAEGQYSRNILPPEEKFYLGGAHFTRGFYSGEVTADSGLALTAEPRIDTKIKQFGTLPHWLGGDLPAVQFYGFYDWGEAWQNQTTDAGHTLRSVGGGARIFAGPRVEVDVEGVSRLTRTPDGAAPEVSRLKSSALYWQVVCRF